MRARWGDELRKEEEEKRNDRDKEKEEKRREGVGREEGS